MAGGRLLGPGRTAMTPLMYSAGPTSLHYSVRNETENPTDSAKKSGSDFKPLKISTPLFLGGLSRVLFPTEQPTLDRVVKLGP